MMSEKKCDPGDMERIRHALNIIGNKWTLLILRELYHGTKRFGELRKSIVGISPKVLTDQLRKLEEEGVINRKIYPEIPPRVEYSLTEMGGDLCPVFEAINEWSRKYC